jgi:hypothetical protein
LSPPAVERSGRESLRRLFLYKLKKGFEGIIMKVCKGWGRRPPGSEAQLGRSAGDGSQPTNMWMEIPIQGQGRTKVKVKTRPDQTRPDQTNGRLSPANPQRAAGEENKERMLLTSKSAKAVLSALSQ